MNGRDLQAIDSQVTEPTVLKCLDYTQLATQTKSTSLNKTLSSSQMLCHKILKSTMHKWDDQQTRNLIWANPGSFNILRLGQGEYVIYIFSG